MKMERFTTNKQDNVNAEEIDLYGQDLNALPAFCPNISTMTQTNANNVLTECILKEALNSVLLKVDFLNRIRVISIFSELLFIGQFYKIQFQ